MDEEKYKEELKANGVDLSDLEEKTEPEEPKEPVAPEEPKQPVKDPKEEVEPEGDPKKEPDEKKPDDLQKKQPVEPRKPRTIYENYKEKKAEVKTEKERADNAERERDELKQKLDEISTKANNGKSTTADEKDAIAYAEEIGADPDLVKRIIADSRKGIISPDIDSLKKDIDELKSTNQKAIDENNKILEQQAFDEEFQSVLPAIKEFFPSASTEEIKSIKKELDSLSHKKDWFDKSLDYIVFKNKDSLSVFVSPKKRGLEPRENKDVDIEDYEFDPTADLSKMSPKERDKWESEYRKAGKSDELLQGKDGKKYIL